MFQHWVRWAWFVGLVIFGALLIVMSQGRHDQKEMDNRFHEFKDTVHIKLLVKLKEGPYLHRVIDEELGKVCYLNAVGGGIQCFSLNDATSGMNEEDIKKLTKKYNRPHRYNYNQ